MVELAPGVLVRHVVAGPVRGPGQERPAQPAVRVHRGRAAGGGAARARLVRRRALALLALRPGRLAGPRPLGRAAGAHRAHPGPGQERRAGRRRRARAEGAGDRRGPGRRRGRPARSRNTEDEARELVDLYGADPAPDRHDPARAWTSPASAPATGPPRGRALARPPDAVVLAFAGRIQPLKAPDVLLRAAAALLRRDPALRRGWWCSWRAGRRAAGWPSRRRCTARRRAGHRRRRALPPAAGRRRAGRRLPGGGRRRGAQPQRVVRAGRAGGAGLRDAGGRRAGGRAAGRGGGRAVRAARRRAPRRSRGRTRWRRWRWIRPGGRRWRAGPWRTRSGSPGTARPTRCWTPTTGAAAEFAAAAGGRAARGGGDAVSTAEVVAAALAASWGSSTRSAGPASSW